MNYSYGLTNMRMQYKYRNTLIINLPIYDDKNYIK